MHGLHVSPEGNGDNVFVTVEPGESFDYDYRLPDDHPPGVFWYHPHHHGTVADQVFGGLYGAIVVEGPEELPVARERVLVVSDTSLDADGQLRQPSAMERMMGREGDLVLLNGQVRPTLTARPGVGEPAGRGRRPGPGQPRRPAGHHRRRHQHPGRARGGPRRHGRHDGRIGVR